jgi:hypothetical protein
LSKSCVDDLARNMTCGTLLCEKVLAEPAGGNVLLLIQGSGTCRCGGKIVREFPMLSPS